MPVDKTTWEQGYHLPCTEAVFDHVQDCLRDQLATVPDTAFTADELVDTATFTDTNEHATEIAELSHAELVFVTRKALDELVAAGVVGAQMVERVSDADVYYRYVPESDRDSVPY